MLKKILFALMALLLLVGIGVYAVGSNLDTIVRQVVEKYGSEATQTTVKLGQVKVSLTSGEAALGKLSLGMPQGFSGDTSFYLGQIAVKIDPHSVAKGGPITIESLIIDKPQITYEVNEKGENNLQTIARNAQAFAAKLSSGKDAPSEKEAKTSARGSEGQKIIIKTLTISNGQVAIHAPLLQGKPLSTSLPTIHMTNIGSNKGGVSPAEIAQILIKSLSESASLAASQDMAKELGSSLKETGKNLVGGAIDQGLGQIKGLIGK